MSLVLQVLGQVGAGAHGRLERLVERLQGPAAGVEFILFLDCGKRRLLLILLLLPAVAARLAALLRRLCLLLAPCGRLQLLLGTCVVLAGWRRLVRWIVLAGWRLLAGWIRLAGWRLCAVCFCFVLLHLLSQPLHPGLQVRQPLLVGAHVQQLLVLLRQPHLPAPQLAGLQRWQVAEEAVRVVVDLQAVGLSLVSGADVTVALAEDGAVGVEAVQELQEPGPVGTMLLHPLDQLGNRLRRQVGWPRLYRSWCSLDDELRQHGVRGRVGDLRACSDSCRLWHVYPAAAHLVHELDRDDGLLRGWQQVAGLLHGPVEVLLAAHERADLLAGDLGWEGLRHFLRKSAAKNHQKINQRRRDASHSPPPIWLAADRTSGSWTAD